MAWTKNLGTMIDAGVRCRASCNKCDRWKDVDLVALAEKVGRDFDLWNKRPRCKSTPGCDGNGRFFQDGSGGFFNVMSDPLTPDPPRRD